MQTSHETWVTFQLAGSKQALILLPVFVDGRGPYSFVLDTGATATVISDELANFGDTPASLRLLHTWVSHGQARKMRSVVSFNSAARRFGFLPKNF